MEVTEEASGISSMSRMLDVLGLNHFSEYVFSRGALPHRIEGRQADPGAAHPPEDGSCASLTVTSVKIVPRVPVR